MVAEVTGVASTTMSHGIPALLALGALLDLATQIGSRWLRGGAGQSVGKRVIGLRLVGETTGRPVGAIMAFLRDVAHVVDGVICYVGFLFPLWDASRQTLADKLVKTVVVRA